MEETIKLNVGDVIKDEKLNVSCTVNDMNEHSIEFSDIEYRNAYHFTVFAMNMFKELKRMLEVKNIRFKMWFGVFSVDNKIRENELYSRLMEIRAAHL